MGPKFVVPVVEWINRREQNSVGVVERPWVEARSPGARRDRSKFFAPVAILLILPEPSSAAAAAGHSELRNIFNSGPYAAVILFICGVASARNHGQETRATVFIHPRERNQYPLEHEVVSRLDLPRDFADPYAQAERPSAIPFRKRGRT